MEFSRDEVRRQLTTSRAEQKAAMRPWRDSLLRVFGSDNDIPASAKAQMLGLPNRRGFLKIGGATVLGAAVLAACGSDATEVAESGNAASATTTTAAAGAADTDLTLLRTATSLEILAVNTYQAAIDSGLVTTADVASAATLFRDQHDEHAGALQAATVAAGGNEFTDPNPFVQENVIDPAVADLTDEASVVELALTLETVAAETYVFATGVLSTTTLRQAIMGIGGVEARHMAVLRGFLSDEQVPVAFMPTKDAITEDAFVSSGSGGGGGGGGGGTTTTAAN